LVGGLNIVEGGEAFARNPELGGEIVDGDVVANPDPSLLATWGGQGGDEDVKVTVAGCWRV
jgi:hypothetical protein